MARLPQVSRTPAITQQITPALSGADIANPYLQIAEGLGAAGTFLQQHDVNQAQIDGANATYRDEDGQLRVDTRENWSKAGDAYNRAALQGYTARLAGDIRAKGAELARSSNGDVEAFSASYKAMNDTILAKVPPEARGAVQTMLESEGSQLFLGVSEQKRKRDIATYEGDIKAEIAALDQDMSALARGGGTATTAYKEKQSQLRTLYGELAANPEFSVGQKEADIAIRSVESRHMAESVIGHIETTLKTGGVAAAQGEVDKLLTDETLQLSPAERRQYAGLGQEAIRGWTSERKVALEPVQAQSKTLIGRLNEGLDLDSPDIDTTATQLAQGGDPSGALELWAAHAKARTLAGFKAMDNAGQAAALETAVQPPATRQRAGGVTRSLPGNIRKIVSDAAVRHGQDPNALEVITWLESRGNPNARNPGSSAGGLHQFIDSTAAQYGLANKFDPEASSDAAARLLADNRKALVGALGREPSIGELYLAHQQGSGGAIKLLTNPNAMAVDVVGAEAVRLNGGNAGMTAQQFANLWLKRAGDVSVSTGANIDPSLVKEYRTEVTKDAKASWDDIKTGIIAGWTPDGDTLNLLSRQLALVDDQDFKDEVGNFFNTEAGAASIANLPADQAAAVISALKGDAADGVSIAQQDLIEAADRQFKQRQEALKADPVGYAVDHGVIPPVPALNVGGGPDALAPALVARQRGVDLLRARGDVGNVPALRPEDQQMLGQFIQTATPAEQAQLLGSMAANLKPDTYMSTMAALAGKDDTKALGAAGALYQDNPDAAAGIIRGRQLLRENAALAPKATDDNRASIDVILPPTALAPALEGSRQQLLEAATARYADLSHAAGDTTGELNAARMTQAVNEVTGGMLDFNGQSLIAPRYGMTQDELDTMFDGLPDAALAGAATAEGQPISVSQMRAYGRLQSVGDGQYMLAFGPDGNLSYAMTSDNDGMETRRGRNRGAFVLDLRNK